MDFVLDENLSCYGVFCLMIVRLWESFPCSRCDLRGLVDVVDLDGTQSAKDRKVVVGKDFFSVAALFKLFC